MKTTFGSRINLQALCVGSSTNVTQLRYLLSLGFDRAKILETDTPTIENVVDAVTAQVSNSKGNSLFFGEYGFFESQLVPFSCAKNLGEFLPVFGIDKIELDAHSELRASINLGRKVLTSPTALNMIATFKSINFLSHSVTFKDAQLVANGTKYVEFLATIPKHKTNVSASAAEVLYEREYRAPTKIQVSPQGTDIISKMAQMLSGTHKVNGGKVIARDLDVWPRSPKEAAIEIVKLLDTWGVL